MQKHKKLQLKKTSPTINVPADKLWEIVKDYQDVGIWNRAINHSTGTGTSDFAESPFEQRTCHVAAAGYDIIKEQLFLYEPKHRQFGYFVLEGLPGFVLDARNVWTVKQVDDNKSTIEMDINMKVKPLMGTLLGGIMIKSFKKAIVQAFEDLTIFAETGGLSSAKTKANIKFQKTTKSKAA